MINNRVWVSFNSEEESSNCLRTIKSLRNQTRLLELTLSWSRRNRKDKQWKNN